MANGFRAIVKPPGFQSASFKAMVKDVRYIASGELSITLIVPIDTEEAQKLGKGYGIMLQTTVERVSMRHDNR